MAVKKEKIFPYVKAPVIITSGWSPWYPKPSNVHRAYDMVGGSGDIYAVYAGLDGKICKTTDIAVYRKAPWLNEYGFSVKCDSGEYLFYNHCVTSKKIGQRVKKGEKIGTMDTVSRQRALRKKWGANPMAFTGRHLHIELIATNGTVWVNPLDYMERVKLGGQYAGKQYRDNKDAYIYTKYNDPKPPDSPSPLPDPCQQYKDEVTKLKSEKSAWAKEKVLLNADKAKLQKDLKGCQGTTSELSRRLGALEDDLTTSMTTNAKLVEDLKKCKDSLPSDGDSENLFDKIINFIKSIWKS